MDAVDGAGLRRTEQPTKRTKVKTKKKKNEVRKKKLKGKGRSPDFSEGDDNQGKA